MNRLSIIEPIESFRPLSSEAFSHTLFTIPTGHGPVITSTPDSSVPIGTMSLPSPVSSSVPIATMPLPSPVTSSTLSTVPSPTGSGSTQTSGTAAPSSTSGAAAAPRATAGAAVAGLVGLAAALL